MSEDKRGRIEVLIARLNILIEYLYWSDCDPDYGLEPHIDDKLQELQAAMEEE